MLMPPRSLYIHVPFCPHICPYCDFHKMRRHEGLVGRYMVRLKQQLEQLHKRYPTPLHTLYIGGGTPSHLTDGELAQLFEAIDRLWGVAIAEVTLEADPLTFDEGRLEFFKALGITRLSIGVQSTQDAVLAFLGRVHRAQEGLQALEMALASGLRVSADLMTALPAQDTAADLHTLAQSGVPHLSVYSLTIEPYTPFALRGIAPDPDKEADDYLMTTEILEGYGLERYEVSSHARPGEMSQHNQVYWHGDAFMAAGPSAAAFLPSSDPQLIGERVTQPAMKAWMQGQHPEVIAVGPQDYVLEMLMTGLRTRRGVDMVGLTQRTGIAIETRYGNLLKALIEQNFLEKEKAILRATPQGLIKLNSVIRAFLEAED